MLVENIKSTALVSKLLFAVLLGFGLAIAAYPTPKQNDSCGVYKVNPKTVTSYVLKPPMNQESEPKLCPAVPKCETQAATEENSVRKTEVSNVDESYKRRHHRRHYRVRAYWR